MKTDTPSLETPQAARLRRRQLIRQLLERDKTPLAILFMAAVVGTLVGLAAVALTKVSPGCRTSVWGAGTYC
ncbi:hypothetical protein OIU92_11740 [Escherichia coli]|nr:hypothetical protein [Escherichia coli]